MKFRDTPLGGLTVVTLDRLTDDRGFFARSYCAREFAEHGLNPSVAQCNVSFNRKAGTLRGLHYQAAPDEEAKLVRVTRGAIFDVAVDIRPQSPTYLKWFSIELTADNGCMLFVPAGFAHGFQTLLDDTEVFYMMSAPYAPASARGLRFDDPAVGISWPLAHPTLSEKDRTYPAISQAVP